MMWRTEMTSFCEGFFYGFDASFNKISFIGGTVLKM